MMKQLVMAFAAGVASVSGLFAATYDVATSEELVAAVASAGEGDEIVLAEGNYTVSAVLALAAGANMRGATGDWKDVTVSGGQTCALLTMQDGSTVSAITFAGGKGHGVEMHGGILSECRVTGCVRAGNHAYGVGVWNDGGQVLGCVIDGNEGRDHFTGIGIYQQGADALIDRCVITNNTATLAYGNRNGSDGRVGLGAALKGGLIRNSLIAWNTTADYQAASYNNASGVALYGGSMVNCTVMFNSFGKTDNKPLYGVTVEGASTVENSIIVDNATELLRDTAVNAYADSAAHYANYDHCLIANPVGGETDCIDFADIAFIRKPNGLPRLFSGSALVDAGVTGEWAQTATDLYGNARVINGVIDIGCEEYAPGEFDCPVTVDRASALDTLDATFTPHPAGSVSAELYTWDYGDGTDADLRFSPVPVSHVFTVSGRHAVTMTATDGLGAVLCVETCVVEVVSSVIYVDAASASPKPPYANPSEAARTIADALAVASDGCTVRIATGTYPLSAAVSVDVSVTIESISGNRGDVIVDGQKQVVVFVLNKPDAVLRNLTVTGGKGHGVEMHGGVLENCRVTDCVQSGAFGVGVWNDGGQVLGCLIDGNQGKDHFTGAGIYQQGAGALIDRCVITNNTSSRAYGNRNGTDGRLGLGAALKGGVIRNSLVAWNTITKCEAASYVNASGVALYGGSMANCTVMFNTCGATDNKAQCGVTIEGSSTVENSIIIDNAIDSLRDSAVNAYADSAAHYANYNRCLIANPVGGETDCLDLSDVEFLRTDEGLPRLFTGSALVDTGVTGEWAYTATDLEGRPRVLGAAIDIGACEYEPPAFSCIFTADRTRGFDSLTATLTPVPEGDADGATYYWDLDGDGEAETVKTDANPFAVTFGELGAVTVTLWATNAAETAGATFSMAFQVLPSVIPVDADHSLEDALAAAESGCSIVIATGTYPVSAELSVEKGVTIRSATGNRDDVRLVGDLSGRVLRIAHGSAVVENVTIARGAPGVVLEAGVLRDCRITACTGTCETAGCKNTGGTIARCIFDNNAICKVVDGVAFSVSGDGALATDCIVTNNGSYAIGREQVYGNNNHGIRCGGMVAAHGGGTIRNTIVAFNDMGRYCHLSAGRINSFAVALTGPSKLENCTVVSNSYEYGYENDTSAVTNDTAAAAVYVQVHGAEPGLPTIVNCAVADNFRRADGRELNFLFTSGDLKAQLSNVSTRGTERLDASCVVFNEGDLAYRKGKFVVPVASGLVNKGRPLGWHAGATDVYGQPRVRGKKGVDIGAVECQSGYGLMLMLK